MRQHCARHDDDEDDDDDCGDDDDDDDVLSLCYLRLRLHIFCISITVCRLTYCKFISEETRAGLLVILLSNYCSAEAFQK